MISPFHFFDVLTNIESQEYLAVIDQLSKDWTSRNPFIPFYTLGAPSYLDGGDFGYEERVAKINPLLREYFGALLSKVRTCLENYLNCSVIDLPGASLPGFHIFGSDPSFTQPIASVHFDLQYKLVVWPEPPCLDSVLSFTLPLILPKHGGGLNWWNIDFDAYQALDQDKKEAAKKNQKKEYLPYEVGKLVLHSGHLLHQIAPASVIESSDRRVTLQGHAARAGNNYYWYW